MPSHRRQDQCGPRAAPVVAAREARESPTRNAPFAPFLGGDSSPRPKSPAWAEPLERPRGRGQACGLPGVPRGIRTVRRTSDVPSKCLKVRTFEEIDDGPGGKESRRPVTIRHDAMWSCRQRAV